MQSSIEGFSVADRNRGLGPLVEIFTLPISDKPWSQYIASGNFSVALLHVEEFLKGNPNDVEARLYWVRCQAEMGAVPLAALSSPLEEIVPLLDVDPIQLPLASHVFLSVASQLLEKNNTRLGVLVLERGYSLAERSGMMSVAARKSALELLLSLSQFELGRSELRRENRSTITALQGKIERYRGEIERLVHQPEPHIKPLPENRTSTPEQSQIGASKRSKLLSSKSIVNDAVEEAERPFVWSGDAVNEPRGELEQAAPKSRGLGNSKRLREIVSALLVVLLLIAAVGAYLFSIEESEESRIALAYAVLPSAGIELPTVESRLTSNAGSLDSVTRRLESMKGSEREGGEGSATVKPVENSERKVAGASSNEDPISAPEPKVDPRKVPDLNQEKLSQAVIESLGAAEGAMTRVRPENGTTTLNSGAKGVALDGSPVQSYEVQQLNPAVMYKTITATRVLTAPSILAETLSNLRPDARVQVVARMGQWLEIRSTGGRRGYIYSQDATQYATQTGK